MLEPIIKLNYVLVTKPNNITTWIFFKRIVNTTWCVCEHTGKRKSGANLYYKEKIPC